MSGIIDYFFPPQKSEIKAETIKPKEANNDGYGREQIEIVGKDQTIWDGETRFYDKNGTTVGFESEFAGMSYTSNQGPQVCQ